jgi:outer membrane murein-binding lipoprotein Lpp
MKYFQRISVGTLLVVSALCVVLAGCANQPTQAQLPNQTPYAAQPLAPAAAPLNTQRDDVQPQLPAALGYGSPTPELPSVPVNVPLSNENTYINVDGNEVHSPAYAPSVPAGASAVCGDGTYSFSQHRSGTCSHHGGVAEWL